MKQLIFVLVAVFLSVSLLFAADFKVNGVYTAWGQSQHAFTFNEDKYNHNYVVQMLRFNVQGIANENLKVVTRFDMAQGWWGVDNSLRSVNRNETQGKSLGASRLFDFKDTNYLFHVDQAYIEFNVPKTPFSVRVGRMWYGLGNKIMVDNNYDGVQIDLNKVIGQKLTFSWAKVSEGVDNLSDDKEVAPDDRGFTDARDAHLFTLNFANQVGNFNYNAYGMYYTDMSINDMNAYVPDHLQFFKTRFSPQVTLLYAVGLNGSLKADKLTVEGELDYLTGKDQIDNTVHGKNQMWDINNGDLSGYNIYLKLNYAAADKLDVGAVVGIGSGDDDPTSGKGNVNKLRTSGFFYITEVWEDSIMPDEEGITPQGLGAPNVRGYRELENTTILQANATFKPVAGFKAFLSLNLIRATQPVYAWTPTADGAVFDKTKSSKDLGKEVDFLFSYDMYKELNLALRGGYFIPGDAAGYLINGHTNFDDPAWELKATITYKF